GLERGGVGRGGGDAPDRADVDLRRLQLPGVVARFAGGVGGVVHVNEVVVALLEVLGGAPHAAAVHQEGGVVDVGVAAVDIEPGLVAGEQYPGLPEVDVAVKLHGAGVLVHHGAVAAQLAVALGDLDIAVEGGDVAAGFGGGGTHPQGGLVGLEFGVGVVARRFDIGAAAVVPHQGALGVAELGLRHPVEV